MYTLTNLHILLNTCVTNWVKVYLLRTFQWQLELEDTSFANCATGSFLSTRALLVYSITSGQNMSPLWAQTAELTLASTLELTGTGPLHRICSNLWIEEADKKKKHIYLCISVYIYIFNTAVGVCWCLYSAYLHNKLNFAFIKQPFLIISDCGF